MSAEKSKLNKIGLNQIVFIFAALSLIIFVTTQMVTNAILSPLGHKLQSLNSEKNELIEENRILEQQIAKADSIIVIELYSKEKFELEDNSGKDRNKTIYVSDKSVQAIKF